MGLFKKKVSLEVPDFPDAMKDNISKTQMDDSAPLNMDSLETEKTIEASLPVEDLGTPWAEENLGEYQALFPKEAIRRIEDIERQIKMIDQKL